MSMHFFFFSSLLDVVFGSKEKLLILVKCHEKDNRQKSISAADSYQLEYICSELYISHLDLIKEPSFKTGSKGMQIYLQFDYNSNVKVWSMS